MSKKQLEIYLQAVTIPDMGRLISREDFQLDLPSKLESQLNPYKELDSGLKAVGKLKWGTHFCQFYQTKQDLTSILVRYFKAGLKNSEFCVWVTSEFLTKEEALIVLRENIPFFSKYLKKGQIEIFPYTDWYLKHGKFEMKRVLKLWKAKHDEGLARGFTGIRVSGNPFWIDNKKDWDDFAAYEAEINKVIDSLKILVLCTYSLNKCGAGEVIDVVQNHEFALIKRKSKWELIESAQRKRAQAKIKESEQNYQSLFENMLEGYAYCKMLFNKGKPEDFIYLDVNPIFEKLTGLKSVRGLKVSQVIPGIRDSDPEIFKIYGRVALTGEPEKFETYLNALDIWLSISVFSPAKGYFVAVFDNISERKILEQQKDTFLGIASHELKTPVTSIKAFAQVLYKIFNEKGDILATEMISKMENQIDKFIGLIADLLDITKIQTGKLQFNKRNFDFNEMVNEIIEEVQRTFSTHKIVTKLQETRRVYGDKERIGQVLINLLTNAIKYSPKKDIVIVKTEINGFFITLYVQDFGIGIPKDEQSNVFKRFYQVDGLSTRTPTGLGLGLYISSEIIKRHSGEIGVKSKLGKGSIFHFAVPFRPIK